MRLLAGLSNAIFVVEGPEVGNLWIPPGIFKFNWTMPALQLEYMTWDGVPHIFVLEEGVTRIGRTPENDLQIDDLALSARHCRIEVTGESVLVRDEESSGGTFLDGEWIKEAPLSAGQILNLGTFTVNVCACPGLAGEVTSIGMIKPRLPVQLSDGSYSCQTHSEERAEFECEACFVLFCSDCLDEALQGPDAVLCCPRCRRAAKAIDWSGLEQTKRDVVFGLLPEGVQKAIKYWKNNQDGAEKREDRKSGGGTQDPG